MNRSFYALSAAVVITGLLAACADNNKPSTPRNRYGFSGTQTLQNSTPSTSTTNSSSLPPLTGTDTSSGTTDSSLVTSSTPSTSTPAPTPAPTPAVLPTPEISYGIPVPGKPGYVTSPHAPNAGFVDVRGFPPGTEVKDPYSGRIFLVP